MSFLLDQKKSATGVKRHYVIKSNVSSEETVK